MCGVVEVAVLGHGEEEEAVEDDDEGGEGAVSGHPAPLHHLLHPRQAGAVPRLHTLLQ